MPIALKILVLTRIRGFELYDDECESLLKYPPIGLVPCCNEFLCLSKNYLQNISFNFYRSAVICSA